MQTPAQTFNEFLTTNLNAAQLEAVHHTSGALLVIAGAGSGKTRVITARIAHLILNEGVDPTSIVALTFTNKAAKEMLERIQKFLGHTNKLPFVGTFHAYCLLLLRRNPELVGLEFFTILDEDDQKKILNDIITRNNLGKQTSAKQLSYQISGIKNQLINPDSAESAYANNRLLEEVFHAYEQERKASKCLDFDDLLLEALKLFKNPVFKANFQARVRHVLVDEYQDTNVVQHELLKQISKTNAGEFAIDSICVVGDEDQSIYSWRGATIANIVNFKHDFPAAQAIKIEQNYRSVQPILEAANYVIKNNKRRNPKKLWSDRPADNRIYGITCLSEYQEGDTIAQCIMAARRKNKTTSIALLYRTHFQSRALEEALIKHSIPYKIIGGVQFYERKEIKDLLAYLRLIVNPFDRPSFMRVINCPARGLGDKFEEYFYMRWQQEPFLGFSDLGKKLLDEGELNRAKKSAFISFLSIFDSRNNTSKPSETLEHIINASGYFAHVRKAYEKEEAQERIENIKELVHAVKHFEENNVDTIELFLNEVALMQEKQTKESEKDPVLLMTLHAAKGLEFDTVIIPGLEDGLLPSSRSLYEEDKLEEERRLFYVGVTRAKEHLLLSHCRYRYTYGQMADQLQSRFFGELPSDLITLQELARASTQEISTLFDRWFGNIPAMVEPGSIATFGAAKPVAQPRTTPAKIMPARPKIMPSLPDPAVASGYGGHSTSNESQWKINRAVKHPIFGVGIIQGVEARGIKGVFVEIRFKCGIKKIAESFLTSV